MPKAADSNIKATRLSGKCHVIATSAWIKHPDVADGAIFGKFPHLFHTDSFDTASQDIIKPCPRCPDILLDYLSGPSQDPLTLMDIFCGAGGMSQGFTRTGLATAICGVDVSRSCCETYQYVNLLLINRPIHN